MVWCRVLGGIHSQRLHAALTANAMWVVVNIRVPFRVLTIIRHLIFRVPKRDPNFDNFPNSRVALELLGLRTLASNCVEKSPYSRFVEG